VLFGLKMSKDIILEFIAGGKLKGKKISLLLFILIDSVCSVVCFWLLFTCCFYGPLFLFRFFLFILFFFYVRWCSRKNFVLCGTSRCWKNKVCLFVLFVLFVFFCLFCCLFVCLFAFFFAFR
jgi:hypothetical protein